MNTAARWLIGGATVHRLAETAYDLVMPLVILAMTGSPVLMGVMFAVGFAAEFVVAVIGGSIVDRVNRKRLLLIVTGAEIAVMVGCGALSLGAMLTPPMMIVAAALIDFLVRLYLIADTAALPRVVPRESLPRANGLMQASVSTAQAVGPVLAGWIISLANVGGALLATAALFLLLFVILTRIPWGKAAEQKPHEENPEQILRHMWAGIRFTFGNRLYRQIAVWRGFFDFFIGAAFLMFIYYMREELRFGGTEIGVATALGAIGAICGGLVFARVQARFPSHLLITTLCAGMSVAFAAMAAMDRWWSAGILLMLLMFQLSLISRLLTLLFQDTVPEHFLGRVTATAQLLTTGFGPLSVLSAAWLAKAAGARVVFVLVAVAVMVLAAASRIGVMSRADWRIRATAASSREASPPVLEET